MTSQSKRVTHGPQKFRTFRIKPKPRRWATDEDLKLIVKQLKSEAYLVEEAGNLGFRLSQAKLEIVTKRLQAKTKRLEKKWKADQEKAQQTLADAFQAAISEIVPVCQGVICDNQIIRAKTSSFYPESPFGDLASGLRGNTQVRLIKSVKHLYCPSCGLVYYNERVERLSQRYAAGEFGPQSSFLTSRDDSPFSNLT